MYVCMYVCMCVCVYVCMCVCVYVCMHACVYTYMDVCRNGIPEAGRVCRFAQRPRCKISEKPAVTRDMERCQSEVFEVFFM